MLGSCRTGASCSHWAPAADRSRHGTNPPSAVSQQQQAAPELVSTTHSLSPGLGVKFQSCHSCHQSSQFLPHKCYETTGLCVYSVTTSSFCWVLFGTNNTRCLLMYFVNWNIRWKGGVNKRVTDLCLLLFTNWAFSLPVGSSPLTRGSPHPLRSQNHSQY